MPDLTDRELVNLLLSTIGSLTLCDHMGDVSGVAERALKLLGVNIDWDEWPDLAKELHRMGVKSVWDTDLWSEEDEEES